MSISGRRIIKKVDGPGTSQAENQAHKLISFDITCCICKQVTTIRTNSLAVYTPEVRATWTCMRHPRKARPTAHSGIEFSAEIIDQKQQEVKMAEDGKVEDGRVEAEVTTGVTASTNSSVVEINEEQIKAIVAKLHVLNGIKQELLDRYYAGSKSLTGFVMEVDSVLESKVRVKGTPELLAQRKADLKAKARKVISKILSIEVK